jgi:hypothetical protein
MKGKFLALLSHLVIIFLQQPVSCQGPSDPESQDCEDHSRPNGTSRPDGPSQLTESRLLLHSLPPLSFSIVQTALENSGSLVLSPSDLVSSDHLCGSFQDWRLSCDGETVVIKTAQSPLRKAIRTLRYLRTGPGSVLAVDESSVSAVGSDGSVASWAVDIPFQSQVLDASGGTDGLYLLFAVAGHTTPTLLILGSGREGAKAFELHRKYDRILDIDNASETVILIGGDTLAFLTSSPLREPPSPEALLAASITRLTREQPPLQHLMRRQLQTCNVPNCATCVTINPDSCDVCSPAYGPYLNCVSSVCGYLCRTCTSVVPNCLACDQGTCLACLPTYNLASNVCSCPASKWSNSGVCSNCNPYCTSCTSLANCASCAATFTLSGASCICGVAKWDNMGVCANCIANCDVCSSATICTACKATFNGSGTSACTCPLGQFNNLGVCTNCAANCVSCTSLTACTSCVSSNYALLTGVCTLCTSPCASCSSSVTTCLTCIANYGLTNTTACENCFPNRFKNGEVCAPCVAGCRVCPDALTCTSCAWAKYLNVNNTCSNCIADCGVCTDGLTCVTCKVGFYADGSGICQPCSPNCYKCLILDANCTHCNLGNGLITGSIPGTQECGPCLDGQFMNNITSLCEPCNLSKCLTCSMTATNCTSCAWPTRYLLSQFNQCVLNCPVGQFYSNATDSCVTCHLSCAECHALNTKSHCSTCAPGYFKYGADCNQLLTCAAGTFLNSAGSGCSTCNSPSPVCGETWGAHLGFQNAYTAVGYGTTGLAYVSSVCAKNSIGSTNSCKSCPPGKELWAGTIYCVSKCASGYLGPLDGLCKPALASSLFSVTDVTSTIVDCLTPRLRRNARGPALCSHYCHPSEQLLTGVCTLSDSNCILRDGTQVICLQCFPGFYINGAGFCSACHPTCRSCSGDLINNCLSCYAQYVLTGTLCVVQCTQGEYYTGSSCLPCHVTCLRCSGPASSDCTDCLPTRLLRLGMCQTDCPVSNYYNTATDSCSPCNAACLTCVDATDQCLTCNFNYAKTGPNCLPIVCHPQCSTCYGTTNSDCATFAPGFTYGYSNAAVPFRIICPFNQYLDLGDSLCKPCSPECLGCTALGRNFCLNCNENYLMHAGYCIINTTPCNIYNGETLDFANSDSCIPCLSANCLVCGMAGAKCTYAKPGFYADSAGAVLVCLGTGVRHCGLYGGQSTACTSGHQILSYASLPFRCQRRCSTMQYRNSALNCVNCDPSCLECFGPSRFECLSCRPFDFKVYVSATNVYCSPSNLESEGYYIQTTPGVYAPCTPPCLKCSLLATTCTECISGFYLTGSTCTRCDAICDQCTGAATTCTRCFPGFTLSGGTCLPICLSHEYLNGANCAQCHPNCRACVDTPGIGDQCTGCYPGFFLSGTRCLPCHFRCRTCVSFTENCLTCNSDFLLSGGLCIKSCGVGFYEDTATLTCWRCFKTCAGCSGPLPTDCTTCLVGFQLAGGFCLRTCLANQYFTDFGLNECRYCHISCLSCDGGSEVDCLSCRTGFYQVFRSCHKCHPWCLTCQGQTVFSCLTCHPGYTYDPVRMYCELNPLCSGGLVRYATSNICRPCHVYCATCDDVTENSCLTCSAAFTYQPATKYCRRNCVSHQYYLPVLNSCPTCYTNCLECSGPLSTECLSCYPGSFKRADNSCLLNCLANQYYDALGTMICQNCHATCATCSGPTSTNCLTCPVGKVLNFDNSCLSSCPLNTFLSAGNCFPCALNCPTCTSSATTACLSCSLGYLLNPDGTCQLTCPPTYYFPDAVQRKCLACFHRCLTCSQASKSDCLSCITTPSHALALNQCLPDCGDGKYYFDSLDACTLCHFSCKTCFSTEQNTCLSCYPGYVYNPDKTCTNSCLGSFYPDASGICSPCYLNCGTCMGPLDTDCLTCKPGLYKRVTNHCETTCLTSEFADNIMMKCNTCHASCQTCTGTQANQCVTCKNPHNFFLSQQFECVNCEQNYRNYPTVCTMAVDLSLVEPKPANKNNKASATMRLKFAKDSEFYSRFTLATYTEAVDFQVVNIDLSTDYTLELRMADSEFLIDLFFQESAGLGILRTLTAKAKKSVIFRHPETNVLQLLFTPIVARIDLKVVVAPDLKTLQTLDDVSKQTEVVMGFVDKVSWALPFVMFLGQSSLAAPIMKFFKIFKLLSRLKLINIFFGAYLELFLKIAGLMFAIGGDRISNKEARASYNTRGRLTLFKVTTNNVEVLTIKYIIYYISLMVRYYQFKISNYVGFKGLSTIDSVLFHIANEGRLLLLTVVGIDIVFYTIHTYSHADFRIVSRDMTTSFIMALITLSLMIGDICAMIWDNRRCRFINKRIQYRKERVIENKFEDEEEKREAMTKSKDSSNFLRNQDSQVEEEKGLEEPPEADEKKEAEKVWMKTPPKR